MMKMKNNENYSICSKCRGKCCKSLPGTFSPDEIRRLYPNSDNNLEKSIITALKSGECSIDWWESDSDDDPLYFLRPSTIEGQGKVFDPSWGGMCIFLGNDGCKLSWENRPYVCKDLKPSDSGSCRSSIRYKGAELWKGIDLRKIGEKVEKIKKIKESDNAKSFYHNYSGF